MGYRSEVAYTITFRDKHLRNAYVNLILAKGDKLLSEALADCYVPEDKPIICFHADHVKWYPENPDVQAYITLYRWARNLYKDDCDYRFVRIGEEIADVEEDATHGDLDDYEVCYVVSMIETSFPKDYRKEQTE
jgi:hypothetical protein